MMPIMIPPWAENRPVRRSDPGGSLQQGCQNEGGPPESAATSGLRLFVPPGRQEVIFQAVPKNWAESGPLLTAQPPVGWIRTRKGALRAGVGRNSRYFAQCLRPDPKHQI